jgi:non-heme chloroperoxidase
VAFDARGHGDSSWDPELRYDTDSMVRDLVYLVEELGQPSPVLVGASMGGGTSLVAVGEDCLQAAGLVLVDVAPTVEPTGVERIHSFMFGNTDGFASLEDVALAIHEYQPHREGSHDLGGLAKNVRLGQDGRYYWHWDPRIEFSIDQRFREERFAACARRLSLPTLLVRGGLSDVLSEEGARSFLEFCPHAEFVNVEGAAHMVAGDRNDIFAQAVVEFLGRSVPVASPEQT